MKYTKQQKTVLSAVQGGVIQKLPAQSLDDCDVYTTTDGQRLNARVVRNLIDKGALRPNDDGLFPGFTQTYSAVQP